MSGYATALLAAGYDVPPTQANFVWVPLGEATTQWAAGCEERKVIVRGFAGHGARVTVSTPEENDRFIAAATRARRNGLIDSVIAPVGGAAAGSRGARNRGHKRRMSNANTASSTANGNTAPTAVAIHAAPARERVPAVAQAAEEAAAVMMGDRARPASPAVQP